MKKLVLIVLFIFTQLYVFCQINKLYNFNDNTIVTDINKLQTGEYLFATESNYDAKLIIINENGDILNQKILDVYSIPLNTIETIDTNFYVLINEIKIINDTTYLYLSLTCYSYDFDTIWTKSYLMDTTNNYAYSFSKTNDNGFIICGALDKGGYSYNYYLLKVDSIGNVEFFNNYGEENITEEAFNVIQTKNNDYIITGYTKKYNNKSNWYIVRTDSLGNQIWDWVLPNGLNLSDGAVADLIQTADGNFVAVGGKTYACDYYCLQDARLLKFDIDKNILLDTLYSEVFFDSQLQVSGLNRDNSFCKIKQKSNGNFLLTGYYMPYPHANILSSKLYEMDNNFNIIKDIKYGSEPFYFLQETIKDFIIENDGSLTMIGDINTFGQTTPSQQVWFIKTDTNYCDGFGSCDTTLRFEFLDLPDTLAVNDTATIHFKITGGTITNMYNARISFNILNSQKLIIYYDSLHKDSIYSLKISKDILNNTDLLTSHSIDVGDSIFAFYYITAADSSRPAINNTVGERIIFSEAEVGIQELQKVEKNINIYPNPATNNLSINIQDLQDYRNKELIIYDIYGRVVRKTKQYTQTDSHEQSSRYNTIKIDISNLEKGVYFVKIGSAVGRFVKE